MNESERMLLDKRDALKRVHGEALKLANRMVAQLGDLRSEAVFLNVDLELIVELSRQLHDKQEEAFGLKRDIKDLAQRALNQ